MIRFEEIRTQEGFELLKKFAATFDHEISDYSITPLVTMSRGEKMFGYFHVLQQPIICPAFHTDPKVCTPRDFYEGAKAIINWRNMSSMSDRYPNGTMYCLLPPDADKRYGSNLDKLGLKNLHQVMYQEVG